MKTAQLILSALLGAVLLNPLAGRAEDIDIYSGLAASSSLPNVLIVLDNAANFDASAPACSYTDSATAPTLSGKTGGIEQCALNNVIAALGANADGSAKINVGIMIYNASGFDTLFPGCQSGGAGGCLMVPLTAMNAAGKAAIMAKIKAWSVTGASSMKSNNEADASTTQEAWAYYGGKTGMSGRTYTSTATGSCQKNFVIFISNAFNNSGTPGDASQAPGTNLASTVNANSALTSAQKTAFNASITVPSGAYGTSSFSCGSYSMPTHNDGSGLYADEWARYMYQVDLSTGATEPVDKNIITYAIGVLSTSCKPDWPALLNSMAISGGGKYFATSSYSDVANALLKILNEVQAVNSVFASSSLPVSVNAQGTFLNQIYMGMFRPDAIGNPRWVGNLKQYQFCYNAANASLNLCDSLSNDALSSAGTGFISPNAVSFWTSKNAAVEPDLGGGFWRHLPQGAGVGYDSPDGELVEKGGAAQVIRTANLKDDYTATAGTSTNPRNVYTYCPSGSGCNAALSDSSNVFTTTNAGITAAMFGSSNITISSIERCIALSTNCTAAAGAPNGAIAVVTTNTPHGYNTGDSVTITGAIPTEYNVTQLVTKLSNYQFLITSLKDLPTSPPLGTYTASLPGAIPATVSGVVRSSAATTAGSYSVGCTPNLNCETATATTTTAHGYTTTAPFSGVTVQGATPPDYNGNKTVTAYTTYTFSYSIPVYPTTPAANTYKAVVHPYSATLAGVTKSGSTGTATTVANHNFHTGEIVTLAWLNTAGSSFSGTIAITVTGLKSFTFGVSGSIGTFASGGAIPSTTPVTISGLSRATTTTSATATATGLTAGYFANGDQVDITTTGTTTNEGVYVQSAVTITCTTSPANTLGNPCTGTTFTYPITVTPATSASGTMQTYLSTPSVTIPASKINRSGTTVTVTGVANTFTTGTSVVISTSGTVYSDESAYAGTWTITCPVSCSTGFTFGPVVLTPTPSATGSISAYSGTAPPAKDTLIKWLRGQDNLCDESASPDTGCPSQTKINIRPSLHGDVLHSRPTVVNYGGTTGVVVYYGANDGVYRAINGNQTNLSGSTLPAPGSELWSFIPKEFFGRVTRMHDNSPVLLLSTTPAGITPIPLKKDYFIDGPSSLYQKIKADGTTDTAYLYLTMRRGGEFIYALDISIPTNPKFMWKISSSDADFSDLDETFSQAKVAFVKGYANPVMIFGAGYDVEEDIEPPNLDSGGRGIYIVDAITGALVWKVTYGATAGCSGTTTKASCTAVNMNYSIPSDITLMDRSGNDGYVDRLYATDLGGNIWRVDLEPTTGNTPDKWQVTQLAALGCSTGACTLGTTPRKFFYAADVVPTKDYDAVLVGSGDREHPLYTQTLSYNVANRFYMVKDLHTGNDATTSPLQTIVTEASLKNITPVAPATTSTYDGTLKGYYITLGAGEKVVNAPLTVAGYTYFGTNTPATPSSNSCTTNLGTAKGYQVSPLTGSAHSVTYDGGGLPPSAVAGAVDVVVDGKDVVLPFCIGCGGDPDSHCKSALCGDKPKIDVSTSRTRTYWYKETD